MSDSQWMGHEPDTYRYNGYGPMENYPGLETYRGPPTMNGHLDRFDCSAMHTGPRHQHPQQGPTPFLQFYQIRVELCQK